MLGDDGDVDRVMGCAGCLNAGLGRRCVSPVTVSFLKCVRRPSCPNSSADAFRLLQTGTEVTVVSEDSRPRSTERPRRASRPAVTGARGVSAGRSQALPAARPCCCRRGLSTTGGPTRDALAGQIPRTEGTRCIGGSHLVRVTRLGLPRWCWRWLGSRHVPRGVWSPPHALPTNVEGIAGYTGPTACQRQSLGKTSPKLIAVSWAGAPS